MGYGTRIHSKIHGMGGGHGDMNVSMMAKFHPRSQQSSDLGFDTDTCKHDCGTHDGCQADGVSYSITY